MIHSLLSDIKNRNLRLPLRPTLIFGVLFFVTILGMLASVRVFFLVCLFIAGIISLLIISRWMETGLIALTLTSFFVKFELGTGTNVPLNMAFLMVAGLVGIWVLRMVIVERNVRLVHSRVNAPALAFSLAVTISLIGGNISWLPFAQERASLFAQLGAWLLYTLPMGLLLLVGNSIRNLRWLRSLTWIFLVLGGIYVVSIIIPNGSILIHYYSDRSVEAMLWNWLAALAFGQVLFNKNLSYMWRILLGILVVFECYAGWFHGRQEWVSGWLPPLVAIFAIVWLYSWRWGLVMSCIGGPLLLLYYSIVYSQVWTVSQQYSVFSRGATLPIMLALIKASPIIGLGPANYYHYTSLFPILGIM